MINMKKVLIMNLLSYTKQIAEKINFYDEIAKSALADFNMLNPFAKTQPLNVTIIWIENKDE